MTELYTIFDLLADLGALIEKNPQVDFTKIDIGLNSEYTCGGVELKLAPTGAFVDIQGG